MPMPKMKMSFKNKVLIPTILIFIVSIFVISANNYRLLYLSVQTKTKENLNVFTDSLLTQVKHLDMIFDTTKQTLNKKHISIAKSIAYILDDTSVDVTTEMLQQLAEPLDILEINIINSDGILTNSNIAAYIGFDYKSTENTSKYMALTDGTLTELCEEPRTSVTDDSAYGAMNHYTGVSRKNGEGFLQLGFNADVLNKLQEEINIRITVKETKFGVNGYGMVLLDGAVYAHPNDTMLNTEVFGEGWYKQISTGNDFKWIEYHNEKYYVGYKNFDGYTILGLVSETEYYSELNQVLFETIVFFLISLIIMIVVVYIIMSRLLKPIKNVTAGLAEIAHGNFDARIEGNYNDEFALIKDAVNDMAVSITSYLNDKLQAERAAHQAEIARLDLLVKVHHDALTSVYNRRYFDETIERIVKSLSRSEGIISVLMIDIDFFKQYNDTYGHSEGDECLKSVAKTINNCLTREDDFLARYGGEEFVTILSNTDETGARIVAEKMLQDVRNLKIKHEKSKTNDVVTISIGITTAKVSHTQKCEDYIKRADEALYQSKRNGRNRYTFLPYEIV